MTHQAEADLSGFPADCKVVFKVELMQGGTSTFHVVDASRRLELALTIETNGHSCVDLAGTWNLGLYFEQTGPGAAPDYSTTADLFLGSGIQEYGPIEWVIEPGSLDEGLYRFAILATNEADRAAMTYDGPLLRTENPLVESQKDPRDQLRDNVQGLLNRAATVDPSDVRGQAVLQFRIIDEYHSVVLTQAHQSFRIATIGALSGLVFFAIALILGLSTDSFTVALAPTVAGATTSLISGVAFHLYGEATQRLDVHSLRLSSLQRLFVANSIAEAMSPSRRDDARLEIIEHLNVDTESANRSR